MDNISWSNMCVIQVLEREEGKDEAGEKYIIKIMPNFPKFDGKHVLTILRKWNTMEDKYQETCTWTHHEGLLKTKHKNKILKAVRGKRTCNIQVNSNKNVCLVLSETLEVRRE